MQWLEDIATVKRQGWIDKSFYSEKCNELTLNSMDAWEDYRTFCIIRNINIDKTPFKSFTTQLGIRSREVPGVECGREKNLRVKRFDLKKMRKHFNMNDTIDEPLIEDDPE